MGQPITINTITTTTSPPHRNTATNEPDRKATEMTIKPDPENTYKYDAQGELHCDDGPAITNDEGYEAWYKHGLRHREDGPAIIDPYDGSQEWWFEGDLHREDGPAIEYEDGYKEWWLHGKQQPSPDTPRLSAEEQRYLEETITPIREDYQIGMEEQS